MVVEEDRERDQRVADEPELRHRDGVEPDQTLALVPDRFLFVDVEAPRIRHGPAAVEQAPQHSGCTGMHRASAPVTGEC